MLKRIFLFLLVVLLLGIAALSGYLFLGKEEVRDVYSFVPQDFIYVVESDQPIRDWKDLSDSKVWKYLKGNDYFADISSSADMLDSLLNNNQLLVKFIKLGDLVISAHMVGKKDYDFNIIIDLKGLSKAGKLGAGLNAFFKSLDYEVSTDNYFGNTIFLLNDPETQESLAIAAIDNILVASYTEDLVKKAIRQTEEPT